MELFRLRRLLLILPEGRNVFVFTLTDRALVVVTESLLGPEGTLSFKVDLVGSEERG